MTQTIDPDNDTGTDYTSLSAWEGATSDYDAQCRASSDSADTAEVTIDFGNSFTITAMSGEEAVIDGYKTDRYRLEESGGSFAMRVDEPGTITGLQIRCVTTGGYDRTLNIQAGAAEVVEVVKCRLHNDGTAAAGPGCEVVYVSTGILKTKNSLFVREEANSYDNIVVAGSAEAYIYSGVVDGGAAGIDNNSSGTARVRNCALIGCDDDIETAPTTVDSCIGEDGDGTNAQTYSGSDWDNEFNDIATYDYTLLTGGNGEGNGADLSSDTDYAVSDDIAGTSRSDWDIGPYEIPAAGGSSSGAAERGADVIHNSPLLRM